MLRFVIPTLFETHMIQALQEEGLVRLQCLEQSLRRADINDSEKPDLYASEFGLNSGHLDYVPWLNQTTNESPCLRADPVILQPTHNGILCRGNEILHLAQDERDEIETIFNDHFKGDGLKLVLDSPSTGTVTIGQQVPADFCTLRQVLGQDISHYLPSGTTGAYWQQVLMETQMLLHRAECNIHRRESGEKTIDSLWFWGKTDKPEDLPAPVDYTLYSDHPVVQQAFSLPENQTTMPAIHDVMNVKEPITIHSWALERSVIQYDTTTWEQAFIRCVDDLILPALDAVKESKIKSVTIVSEQRQYTLNGWHRWRFWR